MQYAIGDVVRIRSGGPAMTVSEVTDAAIVCVWFGTGTTLNSATFAPALLVKISAI